MKIGIPRALLYHRYRLLWETFFDEVGVECITSPKTNKDIVSSGMTYAIDEACLSSKIFLGHVEWLLGKCDYILVPRIASLSQGAVCTKFEAIYDLVKNTFRDRNINLLYYNIDEKKTEWEFRAFLKMGRFLRKKRSRILRAYLIAKQAEKAGAMTELKIQEGLLTKKKIKVLLISHGYNLHDNYIGAPILRCLEEMGVVPIIGDIANKKEALSRSFQISKTIPWAFNRELLGSIPIYRNNVDGIMLISSFPCGPDSLVNEVIIRRVKDKPILNLVLDGQEGNAGLETRIESFIDIIKFKRNDYSG